MRKWCSSFQNWIASHKRNAADVLLTGSAVAPIFTICETWTIADTRCQMMVRGEMSWQVMPPLICSPVCWDSWRIFEAFFLKFQRKCTLICCKTPVPAKERIWRKGSSGAADTNYLILVQNWLSKMFLFLFCVCARPREKKAKQMFLVWKEKRKTQVCWWNYVC